MAQDLKLSYYPWLTQNVDPAEIRRQIEIFASIVGSELTNILGNPASVTVQRAIEVPEQIDKIISGEHQIALMNPLGYIFARAKNPSVTPVAVAKRIIDGKGTGCGGGIRKTGKKRSYSFGGILKAWL